MHDAVLAVASSRTYLRPHTGRDELVCMAAGAQDEAQLLKEAEACARKLCVAYLEHRNAEASCSAGDPSGAIAAAARGLQSLDTCLPHSQVSLTISSLPNVTDLTTVRLLLCQRERNFYCAV